MRPQKGEIQAKTGQKTTENDPVRGPWKLRVTRWNVGRLSDHNSKQFPTPTVPQVRARSLGANLGLHGHSLQLRSRKPVTAPSQSSRTAPSTRTESRGALPRRGRGWSGPDLEFA